MHLFFVDSWFVLMNIKSKAKTLWTILHSDFKMLIVLRMTPAAHEILGHKKSEATSTFSGNSF